MPAWTGLLMEVLSPNEHPIGFAGPHTASGAWQYKDFGKFCQQGKPTERIAPAAVVWLR